MFWKYLNVAYLPAHIQKYSKRNRIHLKAVQVQVRISTAQEAGQGHQGTGWGDANRKLVTTKTLEGCMHGMINHNLSELSTTFMTQKERKRNNALLSAFLTLSLSALLKQTVIITHARSVINFITHYVLSSFNLFCFLLFSMHTHTQLHLRCVSFVCVLLSTQRCFCCASLRFVVVINSGQRAQTFQQQQHLNFVALTQSHKK